MRMERLREGETDESKRKMRLEGRAEEEEDGRGVGKR